MRVNGQPVEIPTDEPTVDLWALSQQPKWWSLESWRRTKSAVGTGLAIGGVGAAVIGAQSDSEEAIYGGLGAIAAGAALKGSAAADVRQLAMLPRCVYLVPLELEPGRHDVTIRFERDPAANATWHDLRPGEAGSPAVYYLRMHDALGSGMPRWSDELLYEAEGTAPRSDWRAYILGGHDLSIPDDPELRQLHQEEGITFQPGPHGRTGDAAFDPDLYRHIITGGRVLWTPQPGTHGFEKITRTEHPPYQPRTDVVKARYQHDALPSSSSSRPTPPSPQRVRMTEAQP